jgi:hypothetical protein
VLYDVLVVSNGGDERRFTLKRDAPLATGETSGGQPLFGPWLSRNAAYRLKASAEEDATTQDIWVPLPKSGGSYFVRLILTADGNNLASGTTPTFS